MAVHVEASVSIPAALLTCWFYGFTNKPFVRPQGLHSKGQSLFPNVVCIVSEGHSLWRARVCLVDEKERDLNSERDILEVDEVHL